MQQQHRLSLTGGDDVDGSAAGTDAFLLKSREEGHIQVSVLYGVVVQV
jgi:hypothetical protein